MINNLVVSKAQIADKMNIYFCQKKWSEIANCIAGRTDNDIKNQWNKVIKPFEKELTGAFDKYINLCLQNNQEDTESSISKNKVLDDTLEFLTQQINAKFIGYLRFKRRQNEWHDLSDKCFSVEYNASQFINKLIEEVLNLHETFTKDKFEN